LRGFFASSRASLYVLSAAFSDMKPCLHPLSFRRRDEAPDRLEQGLDSLIVVRHAFLQLGEGAGCIAVMVLTEQNPPEGGDYASRRRGETSP
jgi:hypothetical protein